MFGGEGVACEVSSGWRLPPSGRGRKSDCDMGEMMEEGVLGGNGMGCLGALGDKGSPLRADRGGESMEELLESRGIRGAGEFIGRSPGRGLMGKPGLKGSPGLSEVVKTLPSELERFCLTVGLRTPAREVGAT